MEFIGKIEDDQDYIDACMEFEILVARLIDRHMPKKGGSDESIDGHERALLLSGLEKLLLPTVATIEETWRNTPTT